MPWSLCAGLFVATQLLFVCFPLAARALSIEVAQPAPTVEGASPTFRARVDGAIGEVELRWDFGDGERGEFTADLTTVEHRYAAAGHYSVIVVARDDAGFSSAAFVHTVHRPLLQRLPRASSDIVLDEARGLVCNVNADNDTVSCIDAESLAKVCEIAVYDEPTALALAPDGTLWVVHRDDFAVAIIDLDAQAVVRGFRLPYGSQPMGIVMAPAGDVAYVPLMATGRVVQLDAHSGEVRAQLDVGPWPRGIALSHDGAELYVTRFISGQGRAEVTRVSTADMTVVRRFELAEDTSTVDSDQNGRGLANYLFSVALSPDGREAWVPSKKDNMARGVFRDGLALTQDNTVRPLLSVVNLMDQREDVPSRMDLDDRNLPVHVLFSPLGDYAFVSVLGSSLVEVRDAYTREFVTAMRSSGLGHASSVLAADGKLFVNATLSRSIVVYDVAAILSGEDRTTRQLADVKVVASEKLAPEVLRGKQIFVDSEDPRMTAEGYLSCASCHFDGFEDGRVWDFADRGEGLRNTTSLLGRRGTGQGPVHWSGNFDEIQDFEGAIRDKFGGLGFMADADYQRGTCSQPLGDAKAGLSADLDALAAYVTSLDRVSRSPFRKPDGTLTDEAVKGREHFLALACERCHAGDDYTDSAAQRSHDVGTLTELSGSRLGGELSALDTPTLLGVWQTAPYLHDGSAATLRDVLTVRNVNELHGAVGALSEAELDELVAYLAQLDHGTPPALLPFELEPEAPDAGMPSADAGAPEPSTSSGKSAGCAIVSTPGESVWMPWLVLLLLLGCRRKTGQHYQQC
jgi:DNA-binding beta-propeller fold protein YncE